MHLLPERIDPSGWWWKGRVVGYAEAVGDDLLLCEHAGESAQAGGLPDVEFEDWWDGYSSGWVSAASGDSDGEGLC